MAAEQIGFRISKDRVVAESAATMQVVDLLLQQRERMPAPPEPATQNWLQINLHQLVIIVDRCNPVSLWRWAASYTTTRSLKLPGAETRSRSWEPSHPVGKGSSDMASHIKRFEAEQDALREISTERLTAEEAKALVDQRKKEFDEVWGIDPGSRTDHTPLR